MDLKNKIIELDKQEYNNKKSRKIVNLLKFVIVDGETDIKKIEEQTPITVNTIQKYIAEKTDILNFITEQEFNRFKTKMEYIIELEAQKIKEEKEDIEQTLVIKIVNDIFCTRYNLETICNNNYFNKNKFENKLYDSDYFNQYADIISQQAVIDRINQNKEIRRHCPKNMFLIEDACSIILAKENLYYLNEFEYKKLKYASSYMRNNYNITSVAKEFNVSVISVLNFLTDSTLEQILKPQANEKLKYYLTIEKLLLEHNFQPKKEFFLEIITFFQENNFDKNLAMKYFGLPVVIFDKILNDIYKMPFFDEQIKKEIKEMLNMEKEEGKVK